MDMSRHTNTENTLLEKEEKERNKTDGEIYQGQLI